MQRFGSLSSFLVAIVLILGITLIGILGYVVIEDYPLFDAFYMTIITVATVGYGEIRPLSDVGRLFTSFLIMASFGTFAYAIAMLSKYVIDGELREYFKSYKVINNIQKLNGHVIVCGYGRNGKQSVEQLISHNKPFVVIENHPEMCAQLRAHNHLFIEGDATQDEMLQLAGIDKAGSVITTLPVDSANLFIVLSARTLNPALTIISRATDDSSDKKLRLAGADHVIMPDKIGGAYMASLVLKPHVVEFIDYLTGQGGLSINLHEVNFEKLPDNLTLKTIGDLDIRNRTGATIIGFRTSANEFIINPTPDTRLSDHCKLFVLGTRNQIEKLRELSFSR